LRLPAHTSHFLQPLDVGLFSPLKKALSNELDPLLRMEISRVRKFEWLKAYIYARNHAFTKSNVLGGWRGAGLFPLNPKKVLCYILPIEPSTSTCEELQLSIIQDSIDTDLFSNSLITSSPPDITQLRKTTSALRTATNKKEVLATPIRKFIPRLALTTERLSAENTILRTRLKAANDVLSARKNQKRGTRIALKDQLLLTTEEIHQTLLTFEKERKERKKRNGQRGQKRKAPVVESDSEGSSVDRDTKVVLPLDVLECSLVE